MSTMEAILIVCHFESVLYGNYSRVSFAHDKIVNSDIGKVINNVDKYDYMGTLPNRIPPKKLPKRYQSRKKCWPKGSDPSQWENHFDLNDPNILYESEEFSKQCLQHYKENLRKYLHLKQLENNCVFQFLCFFLSPSFVNTTFIGTIFYYPA